MYGVKATSIEEVNEDDTHTHTYAQTYIHSHMCLSADGGR